MPIIAFIIDPPKRFEPVTKETCVTIGWFGMYKDMDEAKHEISDAMARSKPILQLASEDHIAAAANVIYDELEVGKALDTGIYIVRHPDVEQVWMLVDPFKVPKDGPYPVLQITMSI